MEAKKVVVDLQQLDLLEERIQRSVEILTGLRRERDAARAEARELRERCDRLQADQRRLEEERAGARGLSEQLDLLKEERQAIRGRVGRLLEMMAEVEETHAKAHADH
jgi:uncharacterized coiled-coil DUF342 family protein